MINYAWESLIIVQSMHNSSHPVDVHVGNRLKNARKKRGLSQKNLADYSGVTFQQVQKYENGSNRISCSRLYEFACFLQVDIIFFFQGLEQTIEDYSNPEESQSSSYIANDAEFNRPDQHTHFSNEQIMNLCNKITNSEIKIKLAELLEVVANQQSDQSSY